MRLKKKLIEVVAKGKVVPELSHIGIAYKPKKTKDKFGEIPSGFVRIFMLESKKSEVLNYNRFERKWAGKKVRIIIEEIK